MTNAMEVLLELGYLQEDLMRYPLKEASLNQLLTLQEQLVNIMAMILRATIGKDCLAHLEQISNGDTTLTNT